MKTTTFFSLFISTLFFCPKYSFAQLEITPEVNAQVLAQRLVGGGVTISNVTLRASPLATGFFINHGGATIGLNSGIVLSTGRVLSGGGSYGLDGKQWELADNQFALSGDPELSALIKGGLTADAAVLEFDFVPLGDRVEFRYVFSSEEYPDYVCSSFNDVFAFFIEGPGITGKQNMALVPGTTIPIAINSINSGIPGPASALIDCISMGPGSPFTQYFIDYSGNPFFTHNGHTVVLTASASVIPCQTYHLKIAIADAGQTMSGTPDEYFDSGVFLEAQSLSSPTLKISNENPLDGSTPYLVEGCLTGSIKVKSQKIVPTEQPFSITIKGTAVNGADVDLLPDFASIPANASELTIPIKPIEDHVAEGIEKLKILVSNACPGSGVYSDSIEIDIRDYVKLAVTPSGSAGVCQGGSIQLNATSRFTTYQWSSGATLNNTTIQNPVATPIDDSTTYICTAELGVCHAQDSVRIKFKSLEVVSKTDVNCAGASTGAVTASGGWEWQQPVAYSINGSAFGIDSLFKNLPVGKHTVSVKDASGCLSSLDVMLVQAYPDIAVSENHTTASCVGTNALLELSASGGKAPYVYASDGGSFITTPKFTIAGGLHTIAVKDDNGCILTTPVSIANDPPISVTSNLQAASCSGAADGMAELNASGGSSVYEYSADGSVFHSGSRLFVNAGPATLFVRDNKGCTATHMVTIPVDNTVTINAGPDAVICEGMSTQLAAVTNAATVLWSGVALSNPLITNPTVAPVTTTTYAVTATSGICSAIDNATVKVLPAPVANAGKDAVVCYGESVQLKGSGGMQYQWKPESKFQNAKVWNPTVAPLKYTEYYLQVKDINGCQSLKFDTVAVSVLVVQAFAGKDTTIAIGQPLSLLGRDLANNEIATYKWSPSLGLNNPYLPDPIAILNKDIGYTLTLTTPEGCEGTDQVKINVFKGPELYVPTAFTPNADGKNDVLKVKPIGVKSFTLFKVFNRWGETVFFSANPDVGWDGKVKGVLQETGVFVWMAEAIDYAGNKMQNKGTVTLIR